MHRVEQRSGQLAPGRLVRGHLFDDAIGLGAQLAVGVQRTVGAQRTVRLQLALRVLLRDPGRGSGHVEVRHRHDLVDIGSRLTLGVAFRGLRWLELVVHLPVGVVRGYF